MEHVKRREENIKQKRGETGQKFINLNLEKEKKRRGSKEEEGWRAISQDNKEGNRKAVTCLLSVNEPSTFSG